MPIYTCIYGVSELRTGASRAHDGTGAVGKRHGGNDGRSGLHADAHASGRTGEGGLPYPAHREVAPPAATPPLRIRQHAPLGPAVEARPQPAQRLRRLARRTWRHTAHARNGTRHRPERMGRAAESSAGTGDALVLVRVRSDQVSRPTRSERTVFPESLVHRSASTAHTARALLRPLHGDGPARAGHRRLGGRASRTGKGTRNGRVAASRR